MACLRPHRKSVTELEHGPRSAASHSDGARPSTWPQTVMQNEDPLWYSSSPPLLPRTQPPNTLILSSFWHPRVVTTSPSTWGNEVILKRKQHEFCSKIQARLKSEKHLWLHANSFKKLKHKTNASNPNCLVGTAISLKREAVDDASCTVGLSHRS